MNGNGNLCRAIVRAGAPLGIVNKQGLSIFNTPVASKQLLFKLLGKTKFICTHFTKEMNSKNTLKHKHYLRKNNVNLGIFRYVE